MISTMYMVCQSEFVWACTEKKKNMVFSITRVVPPISNSLLHLVEDEIGEVEKALNIGELMEQKLIVWNWISDFQVGGLTLLFFMDYFCTLGTIYSQRTHWKVFKGQCTYWCQYMHLDHKYWPQYICFPTHEHGGFLHGPKMSVLAQIFQGSPFLRENMVGT